MTKVSKTCQKRILEIHLRTTLSFYRPRLAYSHKITDNVGIRILVSLLSW